MSDSNSRPAPSLRRLQAVNLLAVGAYTASSIWAFSCTAELWNQKDATLTPGPEFSFARLLVNAPLLGFAAYQFNPQAHEAVHKIGYRLAGLALVSSAFNQTFDYAHFHSALVFSLLSVGLSFGIVQELRPLSLDLPAQHALIRAPFWAWEAWSFVALGFAPSNLYSLGTPQPTFFVASILFIAWLTALSVFYAYDGKRGGDVAGGVVMLWYAIELCCYHRPKSLMITGIIGSIISGLALVYTVVDSIRTAGQDGQIKLPADGEDVDAVAQE